MATKQVKSSELTDLQIKDVGVIFAALALWAGYKWHLNWATAGGFILLISAVIFPRIFKWPAKAWFGLSGVLALVVPRIVFSLIFFLMVTPLAVSKRLFGYDPLKLTVWRKSKESVFRLREKTKITREDLSDPY